MPHLIIMQSPFLLISATNASLLGILKQMLPFASNKRMPSSIEQGQSLVFKSLSLLPIKDLVQFTAMLSVKDAFQIP